MWQQPAALLLVPVGWLLLVLAAWPRRFKPFGAFLARLLLAVLAALALAQPIIPAPAPPPAEHLVLLVDQSASVGAAGQLALRREATRLAQDYRAQTLFFAGQPALTAPGGWLNPEASDLAAALDAARQLALAAGLPPGRVVLLSDGVPTTGDALAAAGRLAAQNIPVDVLLPTAQDLQNWRGSQNEVRLAAVTVPAALRQGQWFTITTVIDAEQPVSVTLKLAQAQHVISETTLALAAGENRWEVPAVANWAGLSVFRAAVSAPPGHDHQPENNTVTTVAQAFSPPQILVAATDPAQGRAVAEWLLPAGYQPRVILPAELPGQLSGLQPYAGLVLVNVPAAALSPEQLQAVPEFSRTLGRGVLVIGGRNSLALGGYAGTPLAAALPVSLEPPPRAERPPVALLLIIDHSGSMEQKRQPASRLALAQEAAIRAVEGLGPGDSVGVLMFDNRAEWVVPVQPVGSGADLLGIQQRITQIPNDAGQGTRILPALETGVAAMLRQNTAMRRHMVLLTDGQSFDNGRTRADYDKMVDTATAAGITLSTIAIGGGADTDLLAHLAKRGLGRYYFAKSPAELPELLLTESDMLRSAALQTGDFGVTVAGSPPILGDLFAAQLPPRVTGYLATTPRPQAEVALQVGPGDPLLAVWGYGLGRVAVWNTDTGAEWAAAWRDWPAVARFWPQVVGYTLPAPGLPAGLQLTVTPDTGQTVALRAEGFTAAGWPVDLARTEASLDGGEPVALRQVAPGQYERRLRLPAAGGYGLVVTQTGPEIAGGVITAAVGLAVPYPAEYARPAAGSGASLLRRIAGLTGGSSFGWGQRVAAWSASQPVAAQKPVELWPWLLLMALVGWPLEIALRRWGRLRIQ